ncbi:fimbria A protein [Pectobacterium betavasculorum]|uniref:Fimbria A protein n=1 Tax=Pectobacterium betavasculorum TaxID=55207 RepID=A0A093RBR9_9GAMM|nr:fimbrial protein [Pectobacterium betavasculorum]KFX00497.1 fimbria A protein [Pectobacterium betavasculorum]KFX14318.1 fimbria A protein [Pectobacterium betavasculorum]
MKHISSAIGLVLALSSGVAFSADQGHGTVTFKGTIIDSPCSITPESTDQTVNMGQISNKALENGGKSTPRTFYIKLENCDVTALQDKTVTTTFSGTASQAQPDNLTLVGTAQGAAIALTNGDGTGIKLGSPSLPSSVVNGNNTLTFAAFLQGNAGAASVVPGEFTSVANFTLAYQ